MAKRLSLLFVTLWLLAGSDPVTPQAQGGVLDLTTLANYANQPRPIYIIRDNTTAGNEITDAGATLGRVLFYDKRLSRDNTVSCSSCHQQAHAFGDGSTASAGVAGATGRHSMRLVNARFGAEDHFFWDKRAATLEAQTSQPIQNATEMGFSGTGGDPAFSDLVAKLSAIPEYRVLFTAAFGTSTIDETHVQRALAQFVRSIQSFDSRYDAGRATVGSDGPAFPNFTQSENNGKQVFLGPPGGGGAGCAACHRPPEFDIDPNTRNNGVIGVIGSATATDTTVTRAPTLRDLIRGDGVSNGPFMHSAVFASLAQVVGFYNLLPASANNVNLDPRLRRGGGQLQNLNLSAQQQTDLAAFLRTLSGVAVYSEPKWSDPFDASGQLALNVLPAAGLQIAKSVDGATVTISGKVAAGLSYQLQSSIDLSAWDPVATLTADSQGRISRTVPIAGDQVFYRVTFTPPN